MIGMQHEGPLEVDLKAMQDRLLAERENLAAASKVSAESRGPVELDQTSVGRLSRMDAMQQQAMALAAERRRKSRSALVEAALRRMAAGDYGWCKQCGDPIAPRRLALDPAAPTCIVCAAS